MTAKIDQSRSPSYPYYDLKKCVELVELFHKANGLAKAPREIAMKHMGLDPNKSWDFRATSSITGYGLLDEMGTQSKRTFQLSDLGKTVIIIKNSTKEKEDALRKAALNYKIIEDLTNDYPVGLPADDVIKLTLIKDYGFTERAASRFVGVFRKTYEFADLEGKSFDIGVGEDYNNEYTNGEDTLPEISKSGQKTSRLTLADGFEIHLRHPEKMSKSNLEFMILWLNQLGLVDDGKEDNNDIPFKG